jgi:O-antigen/teichoic acid export membrane protein
MKAYGGGFASGRPVLILLVAAAVVSSTASVLGKAIVGLGRMWPSVLIESVWALVLLSSAHSLIPRYGATGLAVATLVAFVIHGLAVAGYTRFSILAAK